MRKRICLSCPHRGDVLLTHSTCWRQQTSPKWWDGTMEQAGSLQRPGPLEPAQ
ncbi:Hypothetical protein FKW44_017553 [Caligus rogercresseyi]|uniref:Uncharacterized protein n=1 Tax=Caligus rogercresseyi TaxID=217165 RepID=A0A7T8GT37_CALRO|nr:Hypothetical protein FKW44_017553 [Caligus rogercresseyi]